MTGILIVTHHNLAKAFVETAEMLSGKHDFVDYTGLEPGQEPKEFGDCILEKVNGLKAKGYKDVVVMVDLFGGTPCNQSLRLLKDEKLNIVVGINIPMLLEVIMSNSDDITVDQLVNCALSAGKDNIYDAVKKLNI